jgi:D-amino-acid dehydrogenase
VVLVDAAHDGRATAAGAGIICPWSSRVRVPDWYRLADGGARYYHALVPALAEDGETQFSYRRVGALCVPGDDAELDEAA